MCGNYTYCVNTQLCRNEGADFGLLKMKCCAHCSKEKAGGKGQVVAAQRKLLVLRGSSACFRFGLKQSCPSHPWCLCICMCV